MRRPVIDEGDAVFTIDVPVSNSRIHGAQCDVTSSCESEPHGGRELRNSIGIFGTTITGRTIPQNRQSFAPIGRASPLARSIGPIDWPDRLAQWNWPSGIGGGRRCRAVVSIPDKWPESPDKRPESLKPHRAEDSRRRRDKRQDNGLGW
jgi:hypothetical protein